MKFLLILILYLINYCKSFGLELLVYIVYIYVILWFNNIYFNSQICSRYIHRIQSKWYDRFDLDFQRNFKVFELMRLDIKYFQSDTSLSVDK